MSRRDGGGGAAPHVVNVVSGIGFQFGNITNYGTQPAAGASAPRIVETGGGGAPRAAKRRAPALPAAAAAAAPRKDPPAVSGSVLTLYGGAPVASASVNAGEFGVAPCACAGHAGAGAAAARPIYHIVVPDGATVSIVARDGCVRVDGAVRDLTAAGSVAVRGPVARLISNGGHATVHGVVHTQETRGSAPVVMHFG